MSIAWLMNGFLAFLEACCVHPSCFQTSKMFFVEFFVKMQHPHCSNFSSTVLRPWCSLKQLSAALGHYTLLETIAVDKVERGNENENSLQMMMSALKRH